MFGEKRKKWEIRRVKRNGREKIGRNKVKIFNYFLFYEYMNYIEFCECFVDNWNLKMIFFLENKIIYWKIINKIVVVYGIEKCYIIFRKLIF